MNLTSLKLVTIGSVALLANTALVGLKLTHQSYLNQTQSALSEEAKSSCPGSNIKFNNKFQPSTYINPIQPLFAPNIDTFACKDGLRIYNFKEGIAKTFSPSEGILTERISDLATMGRVIKYRAELAIEAAKDSAFLKSLVK